MSRTWEACATEAPGLGILTRDEAGTDGDHGEGITACPMAPAVPQAFVGIDVEVDPRT